MMLRCTATFLTLATLAVAQQSPPLREESLTSEEFRRIHAPILQPERDAADPALLTERIAVTAVRAGEPVQRRNFVDQAIFGKMERDGIPHAPLSNDAEFLRRITLDLIGRIPAADEIRSFVNDRDPEKRARKVDELLAREAFAEKWAYHYMDLFRANGKMGRGRELFHYWLKENILADRPYDEWVRAIIASSAKSNHVVAASSVIAREHVQGKAQPDDGVDLGMVHQLDTHDELTVLYAKTFLGINVSCVSCHDGAGHLEKVNLHLTSLKRNDFHRMAAFLGKTRYLMYWEEGMPQSGEFLVDDGGLGYDTEGGSLLRVPRWGGETTPKFILGDEEPRPGEHPRDALGRILTAHPQFARATANMFWKQLMGYGIVEPFDEFDLFRQDPENVPEGWALQPTHPALLNELAASFSESGFSVQDLFRTICNSSAYQLSAAFPGEWKDSYRDYFARKYVRMLSAEELHDAIVISTSRPSEFKFGDDTVGMAMKLSQPQGGGDLKYLLRTFGQSTRRNPPKPAAGSLLQPLVLMQTSVVADRVKAGDDSRVQRLLDSYQDNERVVEELFLATLARKPSTAEQEIALDELSNDRVRGAENLQWALINNVEFFFNY